VTQAASAVHLEPSPLDSARFGRRIYRAALTHIDAQALLAALREAQVDTLILRIPASHIGEVAALAEVGLRPIVADTHVDYAMDLADAMPWSRVDDSLRLVNAAASDDARLREMGRTIFTGYGSHYAANPLFAPAAIAEGYADWAARHLASQHAPVWFVELDDALVGFTCCALAGDVARATLNGIVPHARRRGVYGRMLRAMLKRLHADGARTFRIATQVHNFAVQRAWAELGLRLQTAENTVHVNCDFGDAHSA
jgi:GNAT superfamily N-acetyltransferase